METRENTASANEYWLATWLFFRCLGAICLIAFISLWSQVLGLVGSEGILPAADYLVVLKGEYGRAAYRLAPSAFWLNDSDLSLQLACGLGVALSVALIFGFVTRWVLGLIWLTYLSLSVVCQVFLRFQWDSLLLETLLFAFFLAPFHVWPRSSTGSRRDLNCLARWAIWWLAFKLTFLSGATKLLSGDPTWRDLSAMDYHYFTQPLPNPLSWYMAQLPEWLHRASTLGMFCVEMAAPFFMLAPRLFRHVACLAMIGLQVGIMLTGNYGFFNLLTITLYLLLLDDRFFARICCRSVGKRFCARILRGPDGAIQRRWGLWSVTRTVCLSFLLFVSGLAFVNEIVRSGNRQALSPPINWTLDRMDRWIVSSWARPYVLKWTDPFNSISGYGLFRVMTTERPEIVFEVSEDGIAWRELDFRYKPGDLQRAPPVLFGHMPRLDWQMWFSGLYWQYDPQLEEYWQMMFMRRLLDRSPSVRGLLGPQPSEKSIIYIRRAIYLYEFTGGDEPSRRWWKRSLIRRSRVYTRLELLP